MDKKFYISLEAARLLKEKGYNEETDCTIDYNGAIWFGEYRDECDFPCITKAEAIDWLDSKRIVIIVDEYYIIHEEDDYYTSCWGYYIRKNDECVYRDYSSNYQTRLKAKDAAIIKACEFLENGD